LKKQQQKTFGRLASARQGTPSPEDEKFLVLFFKKEPLSSACLRFGRYVAFPRQGAGVAVGRGRCCAIGWRRAAMIESARARAMHV
jgi:hypothetical protein